METWTTVVALAASGVGFWLGYRFRARLARKKAARQEPDDSTDIGAIRHRKP